MATIPEQLIALAVTDTLKKATKPASLTKLPWAITEGSWSEALGWSPSAFTTNPPTGTRSGFYFNTGEQSGNVGIGLKKTTGSLAAEERQFEVWLFYQGGEKPSGYQLAVITNKTSNGKVRYRLTKFVEGVATTLINTTEEFTFNENDSFYLARVGNKLEVYRRSGESLPEYIENVEDATFTKGFSGFGGNGSNPRLINFTVGALVSTVEIPLAASSGTSSSTLAMTTGASVLLGAASGSASTTLALKAQTGIKLQAASGSSSSSLALKVKLAINPLRTRERPPMRVYLLATAPSGRVYRWGEDEPGADQVFDDLADSDSVPGGYKELSATLPRKPNVDYGDMVMGTHLELFGAGQLQVGEYRLERAPRSSGDMLSMAPGAFGYQGHLADDESAQGVPISRDLADIKGPSTTRQVAVRGFGYHPESPDLSPDVSSGMPAVTSSSTGPITKPFWEMALDGGGVKIGRVRFLFSLINLLPHSADPNVNALLYSDEEDNFPSPTLVKEDFSSPNSYDISLSTPERFVLFNMYYGIGPAGSAGVQYGMRVSELAYFDDSGIATQGTWPDLGVLASNVIASALERWAPLINFTKGQYGTIRPTTFVIPHLSFKDPGPVSEWVDQSNRFELNEWGVWNKKTFYLNPRGEREGRKRWVARVAPAGLQETGPQMERLFNGVIVQYPDVDGSTRTIGPPGSGCPVTSSYLLDVDPENPVNQVEGLRRWTKISANGTTTQAGAIRIGQIFLEQARELDGSGSATLNGYVEDEHGQLWPYYCVHAGDLIRFPDASRPGWRYIVNAQRNRGERSVSIDLDAPPDSMAALLERLDVVLVGVVA